MSTAVMTAACSANFRRPAVSSKMNPMHPDHVPPENARALFTDLYELTMAQAYDAEQLEQSAVFEVAFRTLPRNRNFALAAGIASVLAALEAWRFGESDLDYLRGLGLFSSDFLQRLAALRFTGDVYAVPEGTVIFPCLLYTSDAADE